MSDLRDRIKKTIEQSMDDRDGYDGHHYEALQLADLIAKDISDFIHQDRSPFSIWDAGELDRALMSIPEPVTPGTCELCDQPAVIQLDGYETLRICANHPFEGKREIEHSDIPSGDVPGRAFMSVGGIDLGSSVTVTRLV